MHQIPKHIAFIEHYSWTSREATIDKIKYQKVRYSQYWDKNNNTTIDIPENGRCMCTSVDGEVYISKKFRYSKICRNKSSGRCVFIIF